MRSLSTGRDVQSTGSYQKFLPGCTVHGFTSTLQRVPQWRKSTVHSGAGKVGGKEDINLHRTIAKVIQIHKKRNSVQLSAITLDEKARQFKMMSECGGYGKSITAHPGVCSEHQIDPLTAKEASPPLWARVAISSQRLNLASSSWTYL